jgi:hypothetical protein
MGNGMVYMVRVDPPDRSEKADLFLMAFLCLKATVFRENS